MTGSRWNALMFVQSELGTTKLQRGFEEVVRLANVIEVLFRQMEDDDTCSTTGVIPKLRHFQGETTMIAELLQEQIVQRHAEQTRVRLSTWAAHIKTNLQGHRQRDRVRSCQT